MTNAEGAKALSTLLSPFSATNSVAEILGLSPYISVN